MNKQQLQETEDKFRLDWERRSNCTACKVVWGSRGERNQGRYSDSSQKISSQAML